MKKKTKQLLIKIGVALTAVVGSGFLLFGKKNDKKDIVTIKNDKDNELFI
jgi:hypothetical protein